MPSEKPRTLVRLEYARAAEAYLHGLPLEHFMEATAQATQREITVESLALVHARRPEVQYFNELLVQYPYGRERRIRQVVPDNMVVVHDQPIQADGSFDLPLQPVGPFWMLEYVSKNSERKDYEESFRKYERELKVPYYLLFYPDAQELTLFQLKGKKFATVTANAAGRYAIKELQIEVALLASWVRFWFRGELVPLPADLQRQVEQLQDRLQMVNAELRQANEQLEEERRDKERLLAQLRQLGIEPR